MVKEINSEEYATLVENSERPAVLNFGSNGWGPCAQLGPVVSNVAEQVDSVDFYKVIVGDAPELAKKFEIMSIPTLVLIKDGKEVKRSVGFMPEEPLKEFAQS